ncbi:ATP-dependent protease ClpP, protease subunit [Halobacillus karajensis]|uniref:head maturation protease, ClpP-related n=1 Tax=Halobacillus karajensis TaxID=195088 RepID=UPI0008A7390A|nr:head maturation protease, ClpP-related [Halobacillus karajensis]SEH78352.1 ATP-dependent protease ClpP, protease subunit [Halobacillus karajensis]
MTDELRAQVKEMMNKRPDIRFEANGESKEYSLYVYGPIGGFFFSENNAQNVRRKLQDIDAEKIHVHINSPGGSAFEGVAIGNILKNHKAETIAHIDGMAASAASVIAVACDKVIMPENTMMMIHRASTIVWGNAREMEKTANDLKKIDKALGASYKKRFVGSDADLDELLDEETYLTAEEAVAFGLADVVGEEIEIQDLEDLDNDEDGEEEPFQNAKDRLIAKLGRQNEPAAQLNSNQGKEHTPDPAEQPKQNLSKLFLNI